MQGRTHGLTLGVALRRAAVTRPPATAGAAMTRIEAGLQRQEAAEGDLHSGVPSSESRREWQELGTCCEQRQRCCHGGVVSTPCNVAESMMRRSRSG
mmetsp:Transcript_58932/g.103143  ORF Transcript_58932/g.103143 Transcript_58932/m.103143 type:complete len:97 (+) Transcript_58932:3776-4066(+)